MTNDPVFDALEATNDEATFLRFVQVLLVERREAESLPQTADGFQGEWANHSIAQFFGRSAGVGFEFGLRYETGPKIRRPLALIR